MIISNENSLIRISARRKPRSEQFPIQVLLPISCFGPFGTEEPAGNSSYEVFKIRVELEQIKTIVFSVLREFDSLV